MVFINGKRIEDDSALTNLSKARQARAEAFTDLNFAETRAEEVRAEAVYFRAVEDFVKAYQAYCQAYGYSPITLLNG